jgi:hypothetical protein
MKPTKRPGKPTLGLDPYLVTPAAYQKYAEMTTPKMEKMWPKLMKTSAKTTKRPKTTRSTVRKSSSTVRPSVDLVSRMLKPMGKGKQMSRKEESTVSDGKAVKTENLPYNIPMIRKTVNEMSTVPDVTDKDKKNVSDDSMSEKRFDFAQNEETFVGIPLFCMVTIILVCMIPICSIILKMKRSLTSMKRQQRTYQRVEADIDLVLRLENVEGQVINCRRAMEKGLKELKDKETTEKKTASCLTDSSLMVRKTFGKDT